MKTVACLLALCTLALANTNLHTLVVNEIQGLLAADSSLTVEACTTQCDAIFNLIDVEDEQEVDQMCAQQCTRELHANTHRPGPHQRTTGGIVLSTPAA